jgi:DNA-binding response OmpR family regulator
MKTIFVLEDEELIFNLMKRFFENEVTFIWGINLDIAQRLFVQNKKCIDAVVLDGALGSHRLESLPFLKIILRENFRGPIVANSARYNCEMLRAGATHAANEKLEAIKIALNVINSSSF